MVALSWRYLPGGTYLIHSRHKAPGTNGAIERFKQSIEYEHLQRETPGGDARRGGRDIPGGVQRGRAT